MQYLRAEVDLNVIQSKQAKDSLDLITGPRESLFFTGELPFTNTSFGYFNISSGAVTSTQKPENFDLAINWLITGDAWDCGIQFFLHAFGEVSKNPEDEMGLGLGVCLPKFGDDLDLSPLTVSENLAITSRNGTFYRGQFTTLIGCDLLSIPSWFEK